MTKFEYCYITSVGMGSLKSVNSELILPDNISIELSDKELSDVLHDLGRDHWEMVGCGNFSEFGHFIYFKREIY
jgi:trans-2-enoyl-CoA reductase